MLPILIGIFVSKQANFPTRLSEQRCGVNEAEKGDDQASHGVFPVRKRAIPVKSPFAL
jgi:hypothetical protein